MKIEIFLVFALLLNAFAFIAQTSIDNLAEEAGESGSRFFNYDGSFISEFDKGDYTLDSNPTETLPDADKQGVIETIQGFITDIFTTMKNWFLSIPGAKYFIGVVSAVPNFLGSIIGLPIEIKYAIGVIWHGLTVFMFILLLMNRG